MKYLVQAHEIFFSKNFLFFLNLYSRPKEAIEAQIQNAVVCDVVMKGVVN